MRAAVQRRHPLLADRLTRASACLGRGDDAGVELLEEAFGLRPGVGGPVPRDDVEADAEAQRRPSAASSRIRASRGATMRAARPT